MSVAGRPAVVLLGAAGAGDVPGIEALGHDVELRYAVDAEALRAALPGAEILYGTTFTSRALADAWPCVDALRWIHWSGAGVDAVLFDELAASDVVLTSSRGLFDEAMAEYVLGLVIAFAKGFKETFASQSRRAWNWRTSERLAGRSALVVGAGSIGRAVARALGGVGMVVEGVARSRRSDDPDFVAVHAVADLDRALGAADFVVIAAPLTAETRGLFDGARLRAMRPEARLINVGRGAIVDERALIDALRDGRIAGAALDVFEAEPLAADSPLWTLPEVIVSPHMSGDFTGWEKAATALFVDNLARYREGRALANVVDKGLGYVAG